MSLVWQSPPQTTVIARLVKQAVAIPIDIAECLTKGIPTSGFALLGMTTLRKQTDKLEFDHNIRFYHYTENSPKTQLYVFLFLGDTLKNDKKHFFQKFFEKNPCQIAAIGL